jgi:hypothetical protein
MKTPQPSTSSGRSALAPSRDHEVAIRDWGRWVVIAVLVAAANVAAGSESSFPLIDAVRADDQAAVARITAEGADVNAREPDGSTALAWAAMRSNVAVADLLLKAGANPNLTNELGIGPLSLAMENDSEEIVKRLLDRGADPNLARESGETPLMTASRFGQVEVMRTLLDHGAAVNVRDKKFGQTALMWATATPEAVKLLLDHGADHCLLTKTWDVKYTIYAPETFTLGMTGIPWNTAGEYVSKKGAQSALFFAVQNRNV